MTRQGLDVNYCDLLADEMTLDYIQEHMETLRQRYFEINKPIDITTKTLDTELMKISLKVRHAFLVLFVYFYNKSEPREFERFLNLFDDVIVDECIFDHYRNSTNVKLYKGEHPIYTFIVHRLLHIHNNIARYGYDEHKIYKSMRRTHWYLVKHFAIH